MKGIKKILSALIAVVMVLTMSVPAMAEGTSQGTMADAQESWAAEHIERWAQSGIVYGDDQGNFNPTNSLTRGEFATMLVRMLGLTVVGENIYSDLTGNEWYAEAILKCTAAGIMAGSADNGKLNCNATNSISRQESMVMFGRAMGVEPVEDPDLSQFADGDSVAGWAAGYIAPMVEMGIISGVGNNMIVGTADIDRASTMALLDKAIEQYVTEPGTVEATDSNRFVVVNVAAEESVTITGTTAGLVVSAGSQGTEVCAENLSASSLKVDGSSTVNITGTTTVESLSVNDQATVTLDTEVVASALTVNGEASVTISGAVMSMELNAAADVVINADASVGTITANAPAQVTNDGTVNTIQANDAVQVTNNGTVNNANVNADGVVMDGNQVENIYVDSAVEQAPTTSDGQEIPPTVDEPVDTTPQLPETPDTPDVPSTPGGGTPSTPTIPSQFTVKVSGLGIEERTFSTASWNTTAQAAIAEVTGYLKEYAFGLASAMDGFAAQYSDDVAALKIAYADHANTIKSVAPATHSAAITSIVDAMDPDSLFSGTAEERRDFITDIADGIEALFDGTGNVNEMTAFLNTINGYEGITVSGDISALSALMCNANQSLGTLYANNGYQDFSFTVSIDGAPTLGTITLTIAGA